MRCFRRGKRSRRILPIRGGGLLLSIALGQTACFSPSVRPPDGISPARLESAVRFLASDDMRGRRAGSPEGKRVAEWLRDRFREIGLQPLPGRGYFHEFELDRRTCRNVLGLQPGSDPARKDEWVIVGAHYDGLGVSGDQILNGADDNATGVAALLELARAAAVVPPPRSVLFVSFDAEERGLIGSCRFVREQVVPLDRISSMICLDMLGGHFFRPEMDAVYALGTEHSPELDEIVAGLQEPGLRVVRLGISLLEPLGTAVARSDYKPFRDRRVPFVFFSTGQPWYYHTIHDDAERIDWEKLARVTRMLLRALRACAALPRRPSFLESPELPTGQVSYLISRLDLILSGGASLRLTDTAVRLLKRQRERLERVVRSGRVDPQGRVALQETLIALFRLVAASRPIPP